MAMSSCARQACWVKSLLAEIQLPIKEIPIYGDNQGSIFLASNPAQEKRTKHIDIRYHHICECVEDKKIILEFVNGDENPANLFTKNLGWIKFYKFCEQLGLIFKGLPP